MLISFMENGIGKLKRPQYMREKQIGYGSGWGI
jgi:hypothetical protein